jgi:hypothetical protein
MLPFILETPRRRLFASGLLDTGSDRSFLPPELARRLAVQPRRADLEVKVMGSVIPAGRAAVDVEIPGRAGPTRIESVEFLVPVPPVDVRFVVLGRNPVFERFEVRIQDWRGRFALVRRDSRIARSGGAGSAPSRSLSAGPPQDSPTPDSCTIRGGAELMKSGGLILMNRLAPGPPALHLKAPWGP